MKKILLLALALTGSLQGKTQNGDYINYNKGLESLGGCFSYYNTTNKNTLNSNLTSESRFRFTPNYSYFLNQNVSIGVDAGYKSKATKTITEFGSYESTQKSSTGSFVFDPYVRYQRRLSDKLYYTATANIEMSFGSITDQSSSTNPNIPAVEEKGKVNEFGININPGLTYAFNKSWAANLNLGMLQYASETTKYDGDPTKYTENYFCFDYSLNNVNLGVAYYFTCGGNKINPVQNVR